jgi:hypothetical protein
VRAMLSVARGDREGALRDQARSYELAQTRYDPFQQLGSLASTALIYAELGKLAEARGLAAQVPPLVREIGLHGVLTRLALHAEELGIGDDLRDAVAANAGPSVPFWREVIGHILAGELEAAADSLSSAGNPTIEANLRMHAGLRMLQTGRRTDAQVELERALTFYRSVDAAGYVAKIEAALGGAQSESA